MRTIEHRLFWGLASGLLIVAPFVGSCDQVRDYLAQSCSEAEGSYETALSEEETELKPSGEFGDRQSRPAHFGLTLSEGLLSDLANLALEPVLESALAFASTVKIDGQSVNLDTDGDVLDVELTADEACDHCFGVTTQLGGEILAEIPSFGSERANLGGDFHFVAPLFLAPGDDKSVAVKLDLEKFAEYGATDVSARLLNFSDAWESELRGPLSNLIQSAVDNHLDEAVTLLEFNGPSFGLEGFELTPAVLQTDDEQGSVFAGFSANIAALNEETISGVESVTDLGPDQNIALSFQPELVLHVLALLIGADEVARRYTGEGAADANGPFHVTLDAFEAGERADASEVEPDSFSGDEVLSDVGAVSMADVASSDVDSRASSSDGRATPFDLDFAVHRFETGGLCFSAGAQALGNAGIQDGDLSIGISDVKFTGDGVPRGVLDLANWTTSQFIQETKSLVQKSIEGENLKVPGTEMGIGPVAVGFRPNTFILRGSSAVDDDSDS